MPTQPNDLSVCLDVNTFSSHREILGCPNTPGRLALLGHDAYWHLTKQEFVSHISEDQLGCTLDFNYEVNHSPRYLSILFYALQAYFDYRSSYISSLIQQAIKKGSLNLLEQAWL